MTIKFLSDWQKFRAGQVKSVEPDVARYLIEEGIAVEYKTNQRFGYNNRRMSNFHRK